MPMYDDRSWAANRISRPNCGDESLVSVLELDVFPLDEASAQADIKTPTVSVTTDTTCRREYDLPFSHPAAMVVTLPKLRRMM